MISSELKLFLLFQIITNTAGLKQYKFNVKNVSFKYSTE